jgi:DUF4097 and DUF4098 domain-containing protein YvlB
MAMSAGDETFRLNLRHCGQEGVTMKPRALFPVLLFAVAATVSADSRVERTLKLEPGGTFRLDSDIGAVVVRGKEGAGAHVLFESSRADLQEEFDFKFDERPGEVVVTAKSRHHGWFDGGYHGRVEVTVEVPAETAVDIHTAGGSIRLSATKRPAKLRTSGGSLTIEDLSGDLDGDTSGGSVHVRNAAGKVRVRTSGGSIEATHIEGPLDAATSGGSVRIEGVKGDLKAHSSGGPIHIIDAEGRVDADTSGGGVDVAFAKGNGKGGRIESSGGGITVSLDPTVHLEIDAHAEGIHSDLPLSMQGDISRESLHGTLNGGGPSLRLDTSGGSIHIRSL